MRKIHVLQFSITNSGSGVTQYVLNNWKYINHSVFQFDFVTFSPSLDFEEQLLAEGCQVFHVKNRAEDNLDEFRKEIRDILKNGYDVIHLHTSFWKSLYMEELAKEAQIPRIIIHAHNSGVFDDDNREKKERKHEFIKSQINTDIATDFWACSWKAADFLYGEQIPKDKIRIMNNAIDLDNFRYDKSIRNSYRKELGLENCFVIGHVGRFSYQKNHKFLIDMFNEVSKKKKDARLMLIGKGPLEDELKEQVKSYGIEKLVLFLGKREDVNMLYNAMDVFCLPSFFEGFPIVAVEAQANGLPCFISDCLDEAIRMDNQCVALGIENNMEWVSKIEHFDHQSFCRKNSNTKLNHSYDIREQIIILQDAYLGRNSYDK